MFSVEVGGKGRRGDSSASQPLGGNADLYLAKSYCSSRKSSLRPSTIAWNARPEPLPSHFRGTW